MIKNKLTIVVFVIATLFVHAFYDAFHSLIGRKQCHEFCVEQNLVRYTGEFEDCICGEITHAR